VFWRDQGKQGGGAFLVEDGGIPVDEVGEGFGTLCGARHSPEDYVVERGDGFEDGIWVEPIGAVVFEGVGIEMILNGDNENAGAGLGHPVAGIEQHGADLVGAVAQRLIEEAEIATAIAGEETDDVFQGDDGGFLWHFVEDAQPFPEETAPGCGEATHLASKREVLTGEAGPDDIALGNVVAGNVFDGAEMKMV
jgi:hypothetical protein